MLRLFFCRADEAKVGMSMQTRVKTIGSQHASAIEHACSDLIVSPWGYHREALSAGPWMAGSRGTRLARRERPWCGLAASTEQPG